MAAACRFLFWRSRLALRSAVPRRACSTVQVTHTGQVWEKDDYRNVRFLNKFKQVNPNWAQDLIAEVPPKEVEERVVSCDGGGGAMGHPKVYINVDQEGPHACGYCGLRFQLKRH